MKVVVKIGGHVFASPFDSTWVIEYSKLFTKLHNDGHQVVVIVGGGDEARKYIHVAKKLGGSDYVCDMLGIEVSRLNARLLITGLGDIAYPEPLTTLKAVRTLFDGKKVVVMGGLLPGQSTNAVGILVAEAVVADLFINATDVDGVYTSNPKTDPTAKKLAIIQTDELFTLTSRETYQAGGYALFDLVAIKIVERSGIPTRIVDGKEPINIQRAIRGENVGTLITSRKVSKA